MIIWLKNLLPLTQPFRSTCKTKTKSDPHMCVSTLHANYMYSCTCICFKLSLFEPHRTRTTSHDYNYRLNCVVSETSIPPPPPRLQMVWTTQHPVTSQSHLLKFKTGKGENLSREKDKNSFDCEIHKKALNSRAASALMHTCTYCPVTEAHLHTLSTTADCPISAHIMGGNS